MILQIKATKANGDVINIYPDRDGDDQTDQEIINVSVGWKKLKSELESGLETLYKNILLFSHGELIEEYIIPTQPEPAKVSKAMQARIKELYNDQGRGAIFCTLETLGSGEYTTLPFFLMEMAYNPVPETETSVFKNIIQILMSYDPKTEYVLVIVPAEGDLDVSIYTFDRIPNFTSTSIDQSNI
jgi:hypothetical protein